MEVHKDYQSIDYFIKSYEDQGFTVNKVTQKGHMADIEFKNDYRDGKFVIGFNITKR